VRANARWDAHRHDECEAPNSVRLAPLDTARSGLLQGG
jgi:hypothetical protein